MSCVTSKVWFGDCKSLPDPLSSAMPAELALCFTLRSSFPVANTLAAPWHLHFLCGLCDTVHFSEGWEIPSKDKRGKKSPSPFHAAAFLHLFFLLLPYFFPWCILLTSNISGAMGLPSRSATSPVWQHICQPPASTAGVCLVRFPTQQTLDHSSACRSNVHGARRELPSVESCSFASSHTSLPSAFALTGNASAKLSSAGVRRFIFSGPV